MIHLREHWEGVSLAGNYTLEQWLGGDDQSGFFQTSLVADGQRAVVKLVPEADVDSAAQLDLWHRIRQLRHPNLIQLLDYGRASHQDQIAAYAVFEYPDDTLASALTHGSLSAEESREVLDTLIDSLRYLHAQGLVMGTLDPTSIVAVGERIKLSTADLREAGTSLATSEDVRLLGVLWQAHLMAASPKSDEIAVHASDPDPKTRWSLAEISQALTPLPVAAQPPVHPVTVEPPAAPPSFSVMETPVPAVTEQALPERSAPSHFPRWILAVAAAFLLVILVLNRPRANDVAATPPVSVPVPTARPATDPKVSQPGMAARPAAKPAPVPVREGWRVIAFTYRSREAAAKKAQQLNQRDPGLHATVFTPKESNGYYLVSLGGRVTHEEAVRLQRSARNEGLPRDLYVQNYSE